MKKQLFSLCALFLFTALLQAQTSASFGIRAGASNGGYSIHANGVSLALGKTIQPYGHVFYLAPLSNRSSLQFEIGYSARAIDMDLSGNVQPEFSTLPILKFNNLDVGLLYRHTFTSEKTTSFYLTGGAMLNYAVSGSISIGNMRMPIELEETCFNRFDASVEVGAGLSFGSFQQYALEFRYSRGLSNLVDLVGTNGAPSIKHQAASLGLSYKF